MHAFLLADSCCISLSTLNPRQKEAVHYIDGPLLVLAGAGSGKTSVITRKIRYLVESCGISAHHITAVTFTNKAAREMKERVSKQLPKDKSRGLSISTFHTLGLNILRREHKALGYKSGFSIFDQTDAGTLIKDMLIQDHGGDSDQTQVIQHQISEWKNDMVSPEQAAASAQGPAEMLCAQCFIRYQQALKAYNAVDFDDLILLPVQLLQDNVEILQKWQRRTRYMLVDEYQDTNISQYMLVNLLVGDSGKLTVVGDDDQSIYAWRGARPENLDQLQTDYPNLKIVKLEQNYRSTARILKSANHLIANNPHTFEKQLWSELGYGEALRVIRCKSEDGESERVINEILDHRLKTTGRFNNYAILYRSNHLAKILELKLQVHKIPYRISGGTSFFARNEIKDIMAYLRLVLNPDDDNAFLRIINVPRRKIGTTTLENLGTYATEREISLYSACSELGIQSRLPAASVERLTRFTEWLDNIRRLCETDKPIKAIREMISDIDYDAWLHQNSSTPSVAEKRIENVNYLIASLENSLKDQEDDEENIESAITKLVLRDMLEQQEDDDDDTDKVHLMTLHASKGLEFPHVFIVGVEEEILPHRNSIETDNIEEERRLCYVGITRAQQTLTMTYCAKRKQFGEAVECSPSRFLEEIPKDDVEWIGREGSNEAFSHERGQQTLAGLKGLFD